MKLSQIATALADYTVVLQPDQDTPEWWAGAPSVTVSDTGIFYLAARMREGSSPRGRRGYEIRILESTDGLSFRAIHHIRREDAGAVGFERPALVRDHATSKYRLYGCTNTDNGWVVLAFGDVDHPADVDPTSAHPVLAAPHPGSGLASVRDFKDPVVFQENGTWHMFTIAGDTVERIRHFTSTDGMAWDAAGARPFMENDGWHNFYTRPAAVLPLPVGYLFVYEGSHEDWHNPVYNIATGLAYSPDLEKVVDLTPHAPLLTSTTPGEYLTWRYSDWVTFKGKLFVYFEAARPNNTNEVRVAVMDMARR